MAFFVVRNKFILLVYTILIAIVEHYCNTETITANGNGETCNGDQDCTINCGSAWLSNFYWDGYCEGDTLNCASNTYTCDINCNQEDACKGGTINCPTDANCIIDCIAKESCQNSNIICPTDADCTIQCNGQDSCRDASITWSTYITNGVGTMSCNGLNSCDGITFPPVDNNIPLTITCDSNYECADATIQCPTDADCTVICSADYSCSNTIIEWPINGQSTLTCTGSTQPCTGATPIPIIIDSPNTQDYILNCNTDSQCAGYTINCPQDWGCFITCNAPNACRYMRINWVETQSYSITCNPFDSSCYGVNSIKSSDQTTPLLLDCSAPNACSQSTIYCPTDADCTVKCDGANGYSCNTMTLYGPTDYKLSVICDQNNACQYSSIHAFDVSQFVMKPCFAGQHACTYISVWFPPNVDGTKVALFTGADASLSTEMKWYAINGWLDIDIKNYTSTTYGGTGSTLHCGIGYVLSCTLAGDQWFGGCGACDAPVVGTGSPTTSIPTTSTPTTSTPTTPFPTTLRPTTFNPTTNAPTTSIPTMPTTSNPTSPTSVPITSAPTYAPITFSPTYAPITSIPTTSTTTVPSKAPTTDDNAVTESPVYETTSATIGQGQSETTNNESFIDSPIFLILIGCGIGLCIFCIICIIYWQYNKHHDEADDVKSAFERYTSENKLNIHTDDNTSNLKKNTINDEDDNGQIDYGNPNKKKKGSISLQELQSNNDPDQHQVFGGTLSSNMQNNNNAIMNAGSWNQNPYKNSSIGNYGSYHPSSNALSFNQVASFSNDANDNILNVVPANDPMNQMNQMSMADMQQMANKHEKILNKITAGGPMAVPPSDMMQQPQSKPRKDTSEFQEGIGSINQVNSVLLDDIVDEMATPQYPSNIDDIDLSEDTDEDNL